MLRQGSILIDIKTHFNIGLMGMGTLVHNGPFYKSFTRSICHLYTLSACLKCRSHRGRGKEGLPMKYSKVSGAQRFLSVAFLIFISAKTAHSASEGMVSAALQWGSSAQAYTYIFSGQVTCHNRPCANAHIDLNLETATQGAIVQTTQAGEDGHYEFAVTVQGAPSDTSTWKLEAHSASVSQQESAEAEGRLILMDGEPTVAVTRSLLLIQA